jgi:hypothetical protein
LDFKLFPGLGSNGQSGVMPTTLTSVLMSAAAMVVLWVCWPYLRLLLGMYTYENGFVGAKDTLDPAYRNPAYAIRYGQLLELGFTPLGLHWERVSETLLNWDCAFGHDHCPCMAAIIVYPCHLYEGYFISGMHDGTIVITTNVKVRSVQASDYALKSLAGSALPELLAAHVAIVDALIPSSNGALAATSMTDFAILRRAHASHKVFRKRLRKAACKALGGRISFFVTASGFGWFVGHLTPFPWILVIVMGITIKVAKRYYPSRFDLV